MGHFTGNANILDFYAGNQDNAKKKLVCFCSDYYDVLPTSNTHYKIF